MRRVPLLTVTLLSLIPLGCGSERSAPEMNVDSTADPTAVGAEPVEDEPLLLEDEPLLLEDADSELTGSVDNSRCYVCHINYSNDSLTITHARAGMGCAACHGESDEHIADESWASGGNGTAPDRMYPKDKINSYCLGCHEAGKLPEVEHRAVLALDTGEVCTDCHGDHRLHERRCKWK